MYFLQKAFGVKWISVVICILLCIYGAEIYQFNVIVDTLSYSWGIHRAGIAFCLLGLVIYAVIGGVSRVAKVCSWIMPLFLVVYLSMCLWVVMNHLADLPGVLSLVVKSAFTGHAALGGFAGSTMMLAIQNGMAGASYSADIGIGYDSIIQSESRTIYPQRQARMGFLGVCLDTFICTMSILVVLVTGLWQTAVGSKGAPLVQQALTQHFPVVEYMMPIFIFILGYTTLIAYLIIGLKCARYLHPKKGSKIYLGYSACALIFFAFFDQTHALLVMRIAGALLLMINLTGIYFLRKEVIFTLEKDSAEPNLVPVEIGNN